MHGRSFAGNTIWYALVALCGFGLLVAWLPNSIAWAVFEACVFGLVIVWAAGWAMGRFSAAWPGAAAPFLGVIAWGLIQLRLGWTAYFFATQTDLIRWACFLAVLFLAYQLSCARGSSGGFRTAAVGYALALAAVSVLQFFAGNGKIFWLYHSEELPGMGPFLNRDHYASFVALILPMAVFDMIQRPGRRWFFALAAAALYASVVAGASRAGFVLVTLEIVLMLALIGFKHRTVPAVALLLFAFVLVVGWQTLYERLRAPDPYNGRREVVSATVNMVRANPWKGYGMGTWTEVYPAFAVKDFGVFVNAAHCDWLQWWSDGGAPVFACMAMLFIYAILLVPKVPWSLGIPVVLLHSLVDFPMQGRFLPAAVFLVLGVAARRSRRTGRQKSERQEG
jgi:O-antigen ligase